MNLARHTARRFAGSPTRSLRHALNVGTLCLGAAALACCWGCCLPGARSASSKANTGYKALYTAYMRHHDQKGRGPANWNELIAAARAEKLSPQEIEKLRDANAVVRWGVRWNDVGQGATNFVLAHDAAAPASGGMALMLDGTVSQVPAARLRQLLADGGKSPGGAKADTSPSGAADGAAPPPATVFGAAPGPPAASSAPVTAATPLAPGRKLWIEWRGTWWPGETLAVNSDGTVRVHYDNYGPEWDENATRDRLKLRD